MPTKAWHQEQAAGKIPQHLIFLAEPEGHKIFQMGKGIGICGADDFPIETFGNPLPTGFGAAPKKTTLLLMVAAIMAMGLVQ